MPTEPEPRRSREPIVISGVGLLTSLGTDPETVWAAVRAGRCGSGPMSAMESALPEGRDGGQAQELPGDFEPDLAREARSLRFTAIQALRSAGLLHAGEYRDDRRAALLGTTLHGIRAGGEYLRTGQTGPLRDFLAGATATNALRGLGFGGGVATTCSACSSSLGAIALAVTTLRNHAADVVLAGGYDTISEYAWGGFNALRVVAAGPLRPFAKGREGMKLAEGYGLVVLERESDARARGAEPIAVLAGWGESADAHHLTKPHPQGTGAARAMSDALARAAIHPGEIGLIAAHATGTPDNDAAEFAAISSVFGPTLPQVSVVAFKSHLGHTLGGAGAVELILSALALREQTVPPCANVSAADLEYPDLPLHTGRARPRVIRATLNTSLGFGGANTCAVLTTPAARRTGEQTSTRTAPVRENFDASDVVITGLGVVLPGITTLEAFAERTRKCWDSVRSGAAASDSATIPPRGSIDDTTLDALISVRRARRLSPCVKLTLAAANLALADASMLEAPVLRADMSAILASAHGSPHYCAEYYRQIVSEGVLAANPMLFAEGVPNAAAAHVSTAFGIRGGCQTIIGTRTAGLDSLRLAALRVRNGDCDRVLVAAAEESQETVDVAYTACGLQAPQGHPARRADAAGFRSGPGAVALVLESARAARGRAARSYGSISAVGSRSSTRNGLARSISTLLTELGTPDLLIGSANGTWIDAAESEGIRGSTPPGNIAQAYDIIGEAFAATSLLGLAGSCLIHSRGGGLGGADLSEKTGVRSSVVLGCDWLGLATGIRLEHLPT